MGQKPRRDTVLLREIAAKLRRIRKELGKSQVDAYIDTEIHVGRVESGRTNISISTLSALCDYYGISLGNFFSDIPSKKP